MTKIFVTAPDDVAKRCLDEARDWCDEPAQTMFAHSRTSAVSAVAEYIANQKGFTLYSCNAKYPKVKS